MGVLIVGYDGSDCAKDAFDTAAELAAALGDRIVVGYGYGPAGPGEEFIATRDMVKTVGERVLSEAMEHAASAPVEVEAELVDKRPAEALLALADKHDARAIVVGSFGESPIRGALLGSVPPKLLHLSKRPVFVVPERK